MGSSVCRRSFLKALSAGSAALGLRYGTALGATGEGPAAEYRHFEDLYRQQSAIIATGGLIKPTTMAGDYGHLGYRPLAFTPSQTERDFICDCAPYSQQEVQQA